jgi:hypothetical protein
VAYSKLIGLRFGLWRFLYDLIATNFDNAFTATQFSNAVFPAQAVQDDPDLLFR